MLLVLLIFSLYLFVGNPDVKTPLSSGQKASLTFAEKSQEIVINGHKFVDLGLPSGLLWAETNVGASSATDDGDYIAWGETKPKTTYNWDTYKWGSKWGHNSTKYNASDGKNALDTENDAASANWGVPCRMPSHSEFEELYNKCNWTWKSNYNGASGYLVVGPNGKSIFFPASDCRDDDDPYDDDSDDHSGGCYWSRSLYSGDDTDCAYYIDFNCNVVNLTGAIARYIGYTVRPVAEK